MKYFLPLIFVLLPYLVQAQSCDPKNTYYLCHTKNLSCEDSAQLDIYGFHQYHAGSYVANKINQSLGYIDIDLPAESYPFFNTGWGSPREWLLEAIDLGYEVLDMPVPHSVALWVKPMEDSLGESEGHVAWVEAVKPTGSFIVSEYNKVLCQFSISEIPPGGCQYFILIPGVDTREEISEEYLQPDARVYRDDLTGQLMLEIMGPGPYDGKVELINYERNLHYELKLNGKATQIPQTRIVSGTYIARVTLPNRVLTIKVNVME